MFDLFKGFRKKKKFDRKTLRKNDISILILDERWNGLFENTQKSQQITSAEESLKKLLKEQANLIAESKKISLHKKKHMDTIMSLTAEAYEKNDEKVIKGMQHCEKEIKLINERIKKIEEELDNIPDRIRAANINLLEQTVNLVYFMIRSSQKRVESLDKMIDETRGRLKEYIDEKEVLAQDYTDVYSYFHDLLGGEELEKLDAEFFKS